MFLGKTPLQSVMQHAVIDHEECKNTNNILLLYKYLWKQRAHDIFYYYYSRRELNTTQTFPTIERDMP